MPPFATLCQQHPLIALHLTGALMALLGGSVVMARPKRTASHRVIGRTFVALMAGTALSSAFIRDHDRPNIAGLTPIDLLIVVTAVFMPLGLWRIRRGQVAAHRRTMTRVFVGACIVAGLFTLPPGRFPGDLLWTHVPGL